MMRRAWCYCATIAAVILFAACKPAPFAASERDDIVRTVLEYQFTGINDTEGFFKVFYIAVGGGDPDPALLRHFQDRRPPVRPNSECSYSPMEGARDRRTGEQGIIFNVTTVTRTGADETDVEGGYVSSGQDGATITFRLIRTGGVWKVVGEQRKIVF